MDRKITDNEIIKGYCKRKLCPTAQEIINRQKAEIEKNENIIRLADKTIEKQSAEIERLHKEVDRLSQCVMYHDGQVADAIKEFAERFRKELFDEIRKTIWSVNGPFQYEQDKAYAFGCIWSCITNKLEEMVGD